MQTFDLKNTTKKVVLALGPESSGNFAILANNQLYFSKDFGDLLNENNFKRYKDNLTIFLKKNKLKPNIVLTDLHPLYKTSILGEIFAKKYKAKNIKIQHHLAHIFSAVGEKIIGNKNLRLPSAFLGIACDGTGMGLDENIWGGEIFRISLKPLKIRRIGHLENQTLLGGDLAIQEPARMLMGILFKFLSKEKLFLLIKKYYSKNEFEVLYNQLNQNFNCPQTSSTGRILDATSLLLGFCENERNYKHAPIFLLEKNSSTSYPLKPIVKNNILLTTPLFQYLLKNIHKDKKRLAATAQKYIAEGLNKIVGKNTQTFFAGGIANNKIISDYFESRGVITNKKIPRGDAGISFGQIFFYLSTNPRD